jgi:arginyl-tRNA synthetase
MWYIISFTGVNYLNFQFSKFLQYDYLCNLKIKNTNDITTNAETRNWKAIHVFDVTIDKIEFQTTRKEFEGDITMLFFRCWKL